MPVRWTPVRLEAGSDDIAAQNIATGFPREDCCCGERRVAVLAELRNVKFSLAWLAEGAYAYVFAAHANGIMKARGINFDIARGFGSVASARAIAGGQFDFGIVAAPTLILSIAKDLPLIALATCDYDSTMGVGVLDDSPVLDLAEKKVAAVPTSGEFPFSRPMPPKSGSPPCRLNSPMSTTRYSNAC